ncbi:MAG: ankyrin repeat domain-containing protein [Ardenticatenaceae bacterium]|nr:ankyrin repeat domain-containing protein [Ardenticatenaceae bacterium]MCB9445371.1 ankyrin repeat domain-containing protein [Ardenticatenaceae bacterium]
MNSPKLFQAVTQLAQQTYTFTEADLEQPWQWRKHDEGVRFALIGTYHELRNLAVTLAARRAQQGSPLTKAQRALAPYHAAYRDLQAVLIGVTEEMYDQKPAPGEWPLRYVLGHTVGSERHFFTLVHYGVERQRDDGQRPSQLPDDEVEKVVGPRQAFVEIMETQGLAEMLAFYDARHTLALDEFAAISDAELEGPSLWWEGEEYSLQYRLHRFDAHLRQHTIQAEKTLAAIGHAPTEARQLLRLVYNALADVEVAAFGAPELGLAEQQALAEVIVQRADDVTAVIHQTRQLATAVTGGNGDQVKTILAENPELVNALGQNRLPLILTAQYHGQTEIVNLLEEAGAKIDLFTASAIGRFNVVQHEIEQWPEDVNEYGRDGFTPLQLACFFGHEAIALWLIEHDADVNAVAQNGMAIAPIHAAAANGNLNILKALLAKGADVNARQQGGFTPLHTTADSNSPEMARLFLEHGADRDAVRDNGQTALDLALEKGHEAVAAVLRP